MKNVGWLIQEARNKGSLTKELFYKLKRLESEKKITIIDGEVKSAFANKQWDYVKNGR